MFHLNEISWIQLFLIEVGVLLLVLAFCALAKETSAYRRFMHRREEKEEADEQGLESQFSDEAASVGADPKRDENGAEKTRPMVRAGQITRTAKVKFVQSFKFLPDAKRQMMKS